MVKKYLKEYGNFAPNLNVRISAHYINNKAINIPNCTTSEVTTNPKNVTCPAHEQENQCKNCRRCWDKNINNVTYLKH